MHFSVQMLNKHLVPKQETMVGCRRWILLQRALQTVAAPMTVKLVLPLILIEQGFWPEPIASSLTFLRRCLVSEIQKVKK